MQRLKIAKSYSIDYLEIDRPSPLSDNRIEQTIQDVLLGKLDHDISDIVYANFKQEMTNWLFASKLNTLTGFDKFSRVDIINGCTQFIDNQYMQGPIQVLADDYRYHRRLGKAHCVKPGQLKNHMPFVIAMPFPQVGKVHTNMKELLDEAVDKHIPVHIDGAWISCCKDLKFNFSHPAIQSLGISLSKGLGLGWNRIGLRWIKDTVQDSISIMNDFNMNNRALAMIGLHFVRNFEPDYLWNNYSNQYYKVCNDFNLVPTNSIYLALKDGNPVGVSPLIRYLENDNNSV